MFNLSFVCPESWDILRRSEHLLDLSENKPNLVSRYMWCFIRIIPRGIKQAFRSSRKDIDQRLSYGTALEGDRIVEFIAY